MRRSAERSHAELLARLFYEFCALAGAAQLSMSALSALGLLSLGGAVGTVFRLVVFRFGVVAPVGVVSVALLITALSGRPHRRGVDAARRFAASPDVLRGLCVSAALFFLSTEVGKLSHLPEMREFFSLSGYPVWFLYVVIAAETAGAVGLLVPTVRSVAACGLSLIMVGAILTHARNGDPFSDSLEAVHLLVILLCIVVLAILQDRFDRQAPSNGERRAS